MINPLHKKNAVGIKNFEPNEGERTLLCSNKCSSRSPSLDFLDTSAETVSEELLLKYLASIIGDIYLSTQCPNHHNQPRQ